MQPSEAPILVTLRDGRDAQPFACGVDLRECYPNDEDGFAVARAALLAQGEFVEGGGAAALVILALDDAAALAAHLAAPADGDFYLHRLMTEALWAPAGAA